MAGWWSSSSKANAGLFWGDPMLRRSVVLAYMGFHASGHGNGTCVTASRDATCILDQESTLNSGRVRCLKADAGITRANGDLNWRIPTIVAAAMERLKLLRGSHEVYGTDSSKLAVCRAGRGGHARRAAPTTTLQTSGRTSIDAVHLGALNGSSTKSLYSPLHESATSSLALHEDPSTLGDPARAVTVVPKATLDG